MRGVALTRTASLRAARGVSEGKRLVAPKPVPSFKPVPFKQDKFLSIKSRTAETYFNARQQILRRSATVMEQVKKLQHQKKTESNHSGESCSFENGGSSSGIDDGEYRERVLMMTPLTSHMADEVDTWNRNLKNLGALQGFVLTDEVVYGAVSRNIRLGAFPYVLDWLRRVAQERRLPVPTGMLRDLRVFIDFVQSALPSSSTSLLVVPETLLGASDVGATAAIGASAEDADVAALPRLVNASPYVRYLLMEMYIPVWECLLELGLLPSVARDGSEAWGLLMEQRHDDVVAGLLNRMCCSGIAAPPSSSSSNSASKENDVEAPTVLQAFTELLLALAQCAAEAKEFHLLIELQSVFCTVFVERGTDGVSAASTGWRLRRSPWCVSVADEEMLCRFANDFLATVYYGRHAYQSEVTLSRCLRPAEADSDVRDESPMHEDHKMEEDTEASSSSSSLLSQQQQQYHTDSGDLDASSPEVALQKGIDELLRELLENEAAVLQDASLYAALALEDASLFPESAAAAPDCRFSAAELQWMRLHCDMCHRCQSGEDVAADLVELFRPGGAVAQSLEASRDNVTDQQCFLALAMETVVAVVAASPTHATDGRVVTARVVVELLSRLAEQQQEQEKPILLPLYSAASAVVLLAPSFGVPSSSSSSSISVGSSGTPVWNEVDAKGESDIDAAHDATHLLEALLPSIVGQPTGFGNACSAVLLVLIRAELWDLVLCVLRKLDDANEEGGEEHGISSVVVDQRVWALTFRKARDAGRADICLLLRRKRERLFY
ncbi:hypothetical protein DQ04_08921030 [Trypanosoma grayi]|uniref:hypothetical protein n=1 Tax=Trypanosoma grayi TaxID=71804 RepID=UPI0004F482E2|nr:hypothetical protein DQ04_08921030 [Trypanosoma grayi]KEG07746.1 hypothetical protein DQ04_08921030 [Trypanosoma grayi]